MTPINLISRARRGLHAMITGEWQDAKHYDFDGRGFVKVSVDEAKVLADIKEDLNRALELLHIKKGQWEGGN